MSIIIIAEDVLGTDAILRRFPDVSRRQLHYWTTRGWVAQRNAKSGTGIPALYTREAITRIQYLSLMVNQLGFSPDSASKLIDEVFRNGRLDNTHIYYEKDNFILGLPVAKNEIEFETMSDVSRAN